MKNNNFHTATASAAPSKLVALSALSIAMASLVSGCATTGQASPMKVLKNTFASDDPCADSSRNTGIAIGALGGAVVGHVLGGDHHKTAGSVIGAGVGGLIGGLIGRDIDRRRCELSKIAKANNLEMTVTDITVVDAELGDTESSEVAGSQAPRQTDGEIVGMSVSITDKGEQFASGAATPTSSAVRAFSEIAKSYRTDTNSQDTPEQKQKSADRIKNMRIFLVGHTDDTGSSKMNAELSEKRAREIAKIFAQNGFRADQIYYQGAGETHPIADNGTEAGRAKNRRVEIVDLGDEKSFSAFLAKRRPNLAFYRTPEHQVPAAEMGKPNNKSTARKPVSRKQSVAIAAGALAGTAANPIAKVEAPVAPAGKPALNTSAGKSSVTTTPGALSLPATKQSADADAIDFGGKPYSAKDGRVDLGKATTDKGGFSIFAKAYAEEPAIIASCLNDRPRHAGEVKSLADGKAYHTAEMLPGLYGKTWFDTVGGHLVVMNRLAVLRDGALPANLPEVKIYKDYDPSQSSAKPSFAAQPEVNVYQGSQGVLVRTFFKGERGLRCMDMVAPTAPPFVAKEGRIVYSRGTMNYAAVFSPRINSN